MSRIHEALKQAAAERAPSHSGSSANLPVPVAAGTAHGERAASLIKGMLPPPKPGDKAKAYAHPLFRELWQCCAQPGWKLDPNCNVFAGIDSLCAEQFRKLRSRVYQIRENEPVRIVQVSSAFPEEGKTFVALNLALTMTRHHDRCVLLVDADLRAPRLHKCLGAPCAPGLSDYLRGSAEEFSIIQADANGDLFFIPAGNSVTNPAELLTSGRFQELVDRLALVFDWIIVDTPPVLPVADASILARSCDGLLAVVRAGVTGYDQVEAALKELQAKRVLGVVLNRAEEEAAGEAYSYYAEYGKGNR